MESGNYTFFKREEQSNKACSQTEQKMPGKHQECHLSPAVLQLVSQVPEEQKELVDQHREATSPEVSTVGSWLYCVLK